MMLVLSRKTGQSIQIAENIFVTVTEVRGGRVRLSIDAPDSIRIVRQELLERDFGPDPSTFADVRCAKPADSVISESDSEKLVG